MANSKDGKTIGRVGHPLRVSITTCFQQQDKVKAKDPLTTNVYICSASECEFDSAKMPRDLR